ncbi:MAG: YetF domain-containing protein [bacterium]
MFNLSIPWWTFIIRGVVVYGFILVLLRLTGKRQIGQMAPFDLVLLLLISNTVQNSMNGGDNSLIGGLISAATLLILNFAVAQLTFKNKRLANIVEGRPEVIIHDGILYSDVLKSEKITHEELESALRQAGCNSISEVHFAILENNGTITVKKKI